MGVANALLVLEAQTVAIADRIAPLEKKLKEASLNGLGFGPDTEVFLGTEELVMSVPCAFRIVMTEKALVVMVKTKPIATVAITFRIYNTRRRMIEEYVQK